MFVPPEQRQPGPPPPDPPPPRRKLTGREEAVLSWLIGAVLVSTVLAPIGGSTLLEAVWYAFTR